MKSSSNESCHAQAVHWLCNLIPCSTEAWGASSCCQLTAIQEYAWEQCACYTVLYLHAGISCSSHSVRHWLCTATACKHIAHGGSLPWQPAPKTQLRSSTYIYTSKTFLLKPWQKKGVEPVPTDTPTRRGPSD